MLNLIHYDALGNTKTFDLKHYFVQKANGLILKAQPFHTVNLKLHTSVMTFRG